MNQETKQEIANILLKTKNVTSATVSYVDEDGSPISITLNA